MNNITVKDWILWIGATATACVSISVFFFQTFETKAESLEKRKAMVGDVEKIETRLQRIEDKIDRLQERIPSSRKGY